MPQSDDDSEAWNDLTLAARCAERDAAAWEEFLRRAGPAAREMMRRLFARGGMPEPEREASEAMGDLAAALLQDGARALKAYRPAWPLRAYVAGVARNVAVGILRKRRSHVSLDATLAAPVPEAEPLAADPRQLEEALASLPARDRLILRLVYWEGASYAVAARVLRVPVGTFGPLLSAAREALRKKLPQEKR